jgi:hypothetical protein
MSQELTLHGGCRLGTLGFKRTYFHKIATQEDENKLSTPGELTNAEASCLHGWGIAQW